LTIDGNDSNSVDRDMNKFFLGDQLLWSKHLPVAWRTVGGAKGVGRFPSTNSADYEDSVRWWKDTAVFEAFLHLLCFRLGWTSPGDGLVRWHQAGRPRQDPVLDLLAKLNGDSLDWFICWAATFHGVAVPNDLRHTKMSGSWDDRHLSGHTFAPGITPYDNGEFRPSVYRLRSGFLVSDTYAGWWNALLLAPDEFFMDGIDVTVKEIGWMGCFRVSDESGIPRATTEDVHMMGVDNERTLAFHNQREWLREQQAKTQSQ